MPSHLSCVRERFVPPLHLHRAVFIVLPLLGCGAPPQDAGGARDPASPSTGAAGAANTAAAAPNLGPFVPTPMPVARRMLEVAGVTADDVVYDLGCGDGRIVIEAAKAYGARGIGIEYDLHLAQEARERAEREGVAHLVEIRGEDITRSDFSDATVVMLYLLPASNEALRPRLQTLKRGTRIVAHDYPIGDWKPLRTEVLTLPGGEYHHVVRLWRAGE